MLQGKISLYIRIRLGQALLACENAAKSVKLQLQQNLSPGHLPKVSPGKTNSCPTYLTGSWQESSEIMDMSTVWKVAMKTACCLSLEQSKQNSLVISRPWPGEGVGALQKFLDSPFPKRLNSFAFRAILGKIHFIMRLLQLHVNLSLTSFPFSNYTYSASPQYSGGFWKIS